MARRRMYLFERAYVDYYHRVCGVGAWVARKCDELWVRFWAPGVSAAFELPVRLAVLGAAGTCAVLFLRREQANGHPITASTVGGVLVLMAFVAAVLWGWKALIRLGVTFVVATITVSTLIAVTLLATVASVGVFIPYLVLLVLLTALSLVVFVPVRLLHSAHMVYRGLAYQCPYDDCGHRGLRMPIYVCTCGEWYYDLRPSFYGIFHHVCQHGSHKQRLPTMGFLSKDPFERLCFWCKRPLLHPDLGLKETVPIAVVGAPNAGKSIFMRQVAAELPRRLSAVDGSTAEIRSAEQRAEIERDMEMLGQGLVLAKTTDDVCRALGITVQVPRRLDCLVHLFDAPGEHYVDMQRLGRKQVLANVKGLVMLIDPLTLPGLWSYAPGAAGRGPAHEPLFDVVRLLLEVLDQVLEKRPTDPYPEVKLAVVLGKSDIHPYLSQLCAHAANPALSGRCREVLDKLGEGRSLRALEQKFPKVRYFACSPLGRSPAPNDRSPFVPVGVTEPILWLLGLM